MITAFIRVIYYIPKFVCNQINTQEIQYSIKADYNA